MAKRSPTSVSQLPLFWRRDGKFFRVWRNDWAHTDIFEVMTEDDFRAAQEFCRRMALPLIEGDDD